MPGWGLIVTEPAADPNTVTPRTNEEGVRSDPSLGFGRPELKNLVPTVYSTRT